MARKKNARKSKYLNSSIQGHLLLRLMVYWGVYNLALLATMVGGSLVAVIPEILSGSAALTFGNFLDIFVLNQRSILFAMAVFCPVLIWDMLRYSHRIAGPIFRFRKAMTDHMNGQPLEEIKLREGDMLIEFQDTWNEFVRYTREQQQQPKNTPSPVQVAAEIAAEATPQASPTVVGQ